MISISEILIEETALASFTDLKLAVQQRAAQGERFLRFDIKPQFADTPEDWESVLESIFTARI